MQPKIKEIKKILLPLILLISKVAFGQSTNAVFIDSNIKVDGIGDESAWKKAKFTSEFWQYFPLDSIKAPDQTKF